MMMRDLTTINGMASYRLPEKEKLKVEIKLKQLEEGFKLNVYEKKKATEKTSDVLMMEIGEENTNRKRKNSKEKTKKSNGKKNKTKKTKKIKLVKKPKEKNLIDKTDPNRRLKPNYDLKVWPKDPLFEMKEKVPFVSSLAHSKLAIRAVLTNNISLLKECRKNAKQVHSLNIKR